MDEARAVIIGAGIAGSSIAYHLTELGWRGVVLVDQGDPAGGTTGHAPGLVGQLRSSATLTRLLMHSTALYRRLRWEGQSGFDEVGSLRLASSPERMEELRRQAGFARGVGLEAHVLSPAEAHRLFPHLSTRGLHGALHLPGDGSARAPVLTRALLEGALGRGARILPRTAVTGFRIEGGRVREVLTTAGALRTEVVVAAAGIWTSRLAALAGVSIPLVPMEHQYAATEPLAELAGKPALPNLRDPDRLVYLRQDGEALVMGGYEREPRPVDPEEIPAGPPPPSAGATLRPFDAARFAPLLAACGERVPLVAGRALAREVCGLESFTADGEFILGELASPLGLWVACGFCAHGVSGAGGVGKVLAEWIAGGEPPCDVWAMDVRRFAPHSRSRRLVRLRASEIYSTYYDVSYPGKEWKSARGLRRSPLHGHLKELGAVFGEKAGWERADWFRPHEDLEGRAGLVEPRGWPRRLWSPAIAHEHRAARERVALFDETSFSKMEVSGPGALALLERLAANRMDRPVGSITYTQLLNRRGGIEADLTVTRLGPDRFRLVTGTAFGPHDLAWIRAHLPSDGSVEARDITSSLACIGIWGPRARDLVTAVGEGDFSNAAFPYLTGREAQLAEVPCFMARVTYVGELGWEVYVPVEYAGKLWEALREAGRHLGATPAGYRAIDSLRLEKGYRYWSAEVTSETNPYEAGLGFAVKLDKEFLGREALLEARKAGLRRRLSCLTLDDPSAVALGGEPILEGDRVLGTVTSAGFGFTVGRSIAYGFLPVDRAEPGTRVELLLFGQRFPAAVAREPLYDAKGERVRG